MIANPIAVEFAEEDGRVLIGLCRDERDYEGFTQCLDAKGFSWRRLNDPHGRRSHPGARREVPHG